MDKTDLEILKILQKKARVPNVEVARTIGMAPSAVLERIKKLEAKCIIQGYEVRLNPDMFNCAMIAFIHITVADPAKISETGKKIAAIDQIQEVHYMAGDDCLLAKIRVADNKELESILRTQITCLAPVIGTKTLISLSTYKETAKILLPQKP
ncbi:MAG: Lrp/AsnC family transcriptional regulator [Desulfobacteraceae bacterium]|nr:Lrp/AsnC family transcriptional regulator [Desulfobacteraceae bacterium]